jgi:TonB family protein
MTETWKNWEGQVADNKFRLRSFLGRSDHSAVFQTDFDESPGGKAVIKFIPADIPDSEAQLSLWAQAGHLTHPNLLRVFAAGRCRLDDIDLLYVVMEQADEDLSQILPQRPLSPQETREVLDPLVDALVYLHDKGLVHGHLKPSNVLAIGDRVKLASDCLASVGDSHHMRRELDPYDAPETPSAPVAAPADIWALGVTLVQTLTQQTPALPSNNQADPVIPDNLPQPFLEIARHALRRNPRRRWSSAEIAAHLNPGAAVAKPQPEVAAAVAAGASSSLGNSSVSPLSVPLSSEPAVPLAKLPPPPPVAAKSRTAQKPPSRASEETLTLPSYVVPMLLGVVVLLGVLFAVPKLFRYTRSSFSSANVATPDRSASSSSVAASTPDKTSEKSSTSPRKPENKVAPQSRPPATQSADVSAARPLQSAVAKQPSATSRDSNVASPAPAVLRSESFSNASATKSSPADQSKGDVLDEVLPQVSEKSLSTIQGIVRVVVKVHVDPAGRVSEATFDAPGPSKYFADLALRAARQWTFSSPESAGRSVPSEWLIRFEYTQSGVHAYPQQSLP